MNFMGKFIATLIIIDTFFVSYAVGFNSRHVLIEDPTVKAPPPAPAKKIEPAVPAKSGTAAVKPVSAAKETAHAAKAAGHPGKNKLVKTNGTIKVAAPAKKEAATKSASKKDSKAAAKKEP